MFFLRLLKLFFVVFVLNFCYKMAMAVHGGSHLLQHAIAPVINNAMPAVHSYSMAQALPSNAYRKYLKF